MGYFEITEYNIDYTQLLLLTINTNDPVNKKKQGLNP